MKQKFKMILDIIMFLMMLTLFSKQLIGMQYHEVAGLILIALIIIHIAVNIRTAADMCKKFIKIPGAIKTGLVVDILLLFCFALLGISGILISHTILTQIASDHSFFKMSHMFAGGLSVILLGVHIGLHICRRPMPAAAAAILSVIVFCGGIYGITNSSEVRWLSIPFTVTSQPGEAGGNFERASDNRKESMQNETRSTGEPKNEQEQNQASAKSEGRNRQALPLPQKIQNIVMFLGMILSCTMITYWISIPKRKNHCIRI